MVELLLSVEPQEGSAFSSWPIASARPILLANDRAFLEYLAET